MPVNIIAGYFFVTLVAPPATFLWPPFLPMCLRVGCRVNVALFVTLFVTLFMTDLMTTTRHASLLWGLHKIETHAIIPLQATQQVFSD